MQRRKFLQGIVAASGAAALPLPATAKVATGAATKVIPFHYGWACVYAQMNNGVSAADIARVFKIPMSDANGLMERMLSRGVIYPPGLDGRSHPTRAWQPWDQKQAIAQEQKRRKANEQKKPNLSNVIPFYYGWACVYARKSNGVSAADIARVFSLSNADAEALLRQMQENGVVHQANHEGKSEPINRWDDKTVA